LAWDEVGRPSGPREEDFGFVPTGLPAWQYESNRPRKGMKSRWSVKYKRRIDCSNPRGFSQRQYCKRKRRGGRYKS
jgi:hypothetical protein